MMPIAPRYRRSAESNGETERLARPILTIPDWNVQVSETETEAEVREEIPTGLSDGESTQESVENHRPVAGRLRDRIHVYWSTARSKHRIGLPRRIPEAIRGILPGIGISISLMFVWFLIRGVPNEPSANDLADQGSSAVIEPISESPLRKSRAIPVATRPQGESDASARVASNPEELFHDVAIIHRTTGDREDSSHEGKSQEQMAPIAEPAQPSVEVAATIPEPRSRQPVVKDPPESYEWSPNGNGMASNSQALTVENRPKVRQVRNRNRRASERPQQRRPQREQVAAPAPTKTNQPTYSYQTTDPSTYNDPAYEVPPVAQRQARATGSSDRNPQATTRETTGRSRR